MIEYQYQERCKILGGEWQAIAAFTDEQEARQHFIATEKSSVDARLIEREVIERILESEYNDKRRHIET